MSNATNSHGIARVTNDEVWRYTKVLFLGSASLFLVNIAFGFNNALSTGAIPRWQVLVHLHSGSIGWITLSLIGMAIWVFTGDRTVSDRYVRRIRIIVGLSVLAFAAFIVSFGLAFALGGNVFALLPIFGTGAMLMIWVAALFALTQLRNQPVVTNVHVLVAGGLVVAAVGATMGVLLGTEYVFGTFLPLPAGDRVGIHAGMMDTYVLLVASAIVEWFVLKDAAGRWTRPGLAQALAGTVGALLVPIAFLTNLLDVFLPVFALLLLVFLVLFLGRMGWKALRRSPLRRGADAWGFFGAVWLVIFVALFIWAIVGGVAADPAGAPTWFYAVFAHSAFVGMMTNLLLGVFSARTQETSDRRLWAEPAAMWLLNAGLVVFFTLKIAFDSRLGALVMGVGVLLGVGIMIRRLLAGPDELTPPGRRDTDAEPMPMG